jgi:hypothetical protein
MPKLKPIKKLLRSPYLVIALVVITGLSISLDAWGLRPWGSTVDYQHFGTWDTFTAGIATVAAVVVALRGIAVERRRATEEVERVRDRELTQVFCWLTPQGVSPGTTHWYLTFENHTGLPVFRWMADLGTVLTHACGSVHGPIRPYTSSLFIPELADMGSAEVPRPALTFTDTVGRTWHRDQTGALSLAADDGQCSSADDYKPKMGSLRREWLT